MSVTAPPQVTPQPPRPRRVVAVGRIAAGRWAEPTLLPDFAPDPAHAARRLWIATRADRYAAHPPTALRSWWAREVGPDRAQLAETMHEQEVAECLAVLDWDVEHLVQAPARERAEYAPWRGRKALL